MVLRSVQVLLFGCMSGITWKETKNLTYLAILTLHETEDKYNDGSVLNRFKLGVCIFC